MECIDHRQLTPIWDRGSILSFHPVTGPCDTDDVKEEKDLEKYKGNLADKIVLFGDMNLRAEAGSFRATCLLWNATEENPGQQFYLLSVGTTSVNCGSAEFM